MMETLISLLLALSLLTNCYLLYFRKKQRSLQKKDQTLTVDARQLLHDLTRGAALVRVIPLDPEGLFFRSPQKGGTSR